MMNHKPVLPYILTLGICLIVAGSCFKTSAQSNKQLFKVLTLTGEKEGVKDLPQDHGLAGVWQRLLKLKTTASVLHTQAHPDDEHADLLTYLGRGLGTRTALLSLNRGEGGGNVLGGESFDELGLLRTEEFLLAGSYYGLDDLYFTRLVDYGFSKRVEEAYEKWGKQTLLGEMVRVIRVNRPLVIISRFHGTVRDGHGNHQAAGEMSWQAYKLAGDSTAFPEQINKEGLRPWKTLKYYRGGVAADEHWNLQLNTGIYSPWLGQTYKNFSLLGYSKHRSQFGGQRNEVNGSFMLYYERQQSQVRTEEKENSFFDGIDTAINDIFKMTGEDAPGGISELLSGMTTAIEDAITKFQPRDISVIIPFLTNGLSKTRQAMRLITSQREALFILQVKEKQFVDAINTAMSLKLEAMAVPGNTKIKRSFYQTPPTMGFAVAGRPFRVEVQIVNNSAAVIELKDINLIAPANWRIENAEADPGMLQPHNKILKAFMVTIPANNSYSQPYFSRSSMQEDLYELQDKQFENLPWSNPELQAVVSYTVNDELVDLRMPVQVTQANLPDGYNQFTLKVAPAFAVNILPAAGIIPITGKRKNFKAHVELINNYDSIIKGDLTLNVPAGWKVQPPQIPFSFSKAGQKIIVDFTIAAPAIGKNSFDVRASATANGNVYTEGYHLINYRDLDQAIQYKPAITTIKGIDVDVAPGLVIGYIMGVGDKVPAGLEQLGARVALLTSSDLASGKLEKYDVIMIGTRAYAVRQDLVTYNQRLLDYAKRGGHLIVLFQTPEYIPARMAPLPAVLPSNAEEISEEDSPVKLLDPQHPVLNYPNKITLADFDNWIEQRGSKFFSKWDTAYVPIISTRDKKQTPQNGGWLMAKYGKGNFTYCAYSFHRQLPHAVEGAFRILANLISYGTKK